MAQSNLSRIFERPTQDARDAQWREAKQQLLAGPSMIRGTSSPEERASAQEQARAQGVGGSGARDRGQAAPVEPLTIVQLAEQGEQMSAAEAHTAKMRDYLARNLPPRDRE